MMRPGTFPGCTSSCRTTRTRSTSTRSVASPDCDRHERGQWGDSMMSGQHHASVVLSGSAWTE